MFHTLCSSDRGVNKMRQPRCKEQMRRSSSMYIRQTYHPYFHVHLVKSALILHTKAEETYSQRGPNQPQFLRELWKHYFLEAFAYHESMTLLSRHPPTLYSDLPTTHTWALALVKSHLETICLLHRCHHVLENEI